MKTVIVVAVVIVLLVVVGFGAYSVGESSGFTQAQNIRSEFFQSHSAAGGQGGSATPGAGTRSQAARPAASGTIKSIQGNTVQLTQQDGSSLTVNLSGQTIVERVVKGASSDLQAGQRISVQGTEANGQMTAQVIQIAASTQ